MRCFSHLASVVVWQENGQQDRKAFSVDIFLLIRSIKNPCLSELLPLNPLLQQELPSCCTKPVAQRSPRAELCWAGTEHGFLSLPTPWRFLTSHLLPWRSFSELFGTFLWAAAQEQPDFPLRFVFLNRSSSNAAKEILPLLSLLLFLGLLVQLKSSISVKVCSLQFFTYSR